MTRLDAIRAALVGSGFPPARAQQLTDRLGRIAKRKARRRKVLPQIDHTRAAVVSHRSTMALHVGAAFATKKPAIIAQLVAGKQAHAEKGTSPSLAKMSDEDAKTLAAELAEELDLGDWSDLVPELQQLLLAVGEDGIRVAYKQVGVAPTDEMTSQVNEVALEYAKDRAAELVGMRVQADGTLIENPNAEWAITDSTREMLRADITRALEEGLSDDAFADQLSSAYAFSAERAGVIAHTEMANADVQGNLTAWKNSGVVEGKEWFLSNDHEQEDECNEAADLGIVPLEDDFGGVGDPPAHPGCECSVSPVVYADDE